MKTKATESDIEDLIEYALNETRPELKTTRTAKDLTLKIKRTVWRVRVEKIKTPRKSK